MLTIPEAARIAFEASADSQRWGSIVINKRRPHTYRAFLMEGGTRICLHRFEACDAEDAFPHPHPWPSAMLILSGIYDMAVGYTADLESAEPAPVIDVTLGAGSTYHMADRLPGIG